MTNSHDDSHELLCKPWSVSQPYFIMMAVGEALKWNEKIRCDPVRKDVISYNVEE